MECSVYAVKNDLKCTVGTNDYFNIVNKEHTKKLKNGLKL